MNSKGKQLAIWGIVLQGGFLIGHVSAVVIVIRAFLRLSTSAPNQSEALASSVSVAVYIWIMVMLMFVVGAVLLMIALFKMKYRAPWFETAMWIVSALWLFGFPIGTVLGIIGMIYLKMHGAEFSKQVEPQALGDNLEQ